MKKYVLAGGPNVGKTSVLDILAGRGYAVVPESARILIERGNIAWPQRNTLQFQLEVFHLQQELEAAAKGDVVFCDRGVPDGIGYCNFSGIAVPQEMFDASRNRYEGVFLFDPIASTDETARTIHGFIRDAYLECGYTPVVVPALPPEERADFILSYLKSTPQALP